MAQMLHTKQLPIQTTDIKLQEALFIRNDHLQFYTDNPTVYRAKDDVS